MARRKNPIQALADRVKKMGRSAKLIMGVVAAITVLVILRGFVKDHDVFFVISEMVHAAGMMILTAKLVTDKSCAGLSLRSQELTAMYLIARLYCSVFMEYNIHTVLDILALACTLMLIVMMRTVTRDTYMSDKDSMDNYLVVLPCIALAVFVHPTFRYHIASRILWAFCIYLEAVSVLPQLRLMQKITLVEPFTALYVFALGISRFFNCAHWLLQVVDGQGYLYYTLGVQWKNGTIVPYGLWPMAVVLAEIVQTFILADFCYYYVKSVSEGQMMVRLPTVV